MAYPQIPKTPIGAQKVHVPAGTFQTHQHTYCTPKTTPKIPNLPLSMKLFSGSFSATHQPKHLKASNDLGETTTTPGRRFAFDAPLMPKTERQVLLGPALTRRSPAAVGKTRRFSAGEVTKRKKTMKEMEMGFY